MSRESMMKNGDQVTANFVLDCDNTAAVSNRKKTRLRREVHRKSLTPKPRNQSWALVGSLLWLAAVSQPLVCLGAAAPPGAPATRTPETRAEKHPTEEGDTPCVSGMDTWEGASSLLLRLGATIPRTTRGKVSSSTPAGE
ncbi:hypothetical protein CIRG_05278 [Coccidioides immitis RMSCC 2394]|uniref:Uncharacterized protein n=1 Tax=Coccidioides immitis RMSCC 2394 TaxID=404692 RepID=A0A0J7B6L9_COCIT|nr:hypothetical protein CIRG_05278 [Coccidioides immitis RMSCC 2394]